jgi:putative ABC transport system permease protein
MPDLRLAVRHLMRRPAFSVIAVVTLALGIGANVAVFTVLHAVLLAPLPYDKPEQVMVLSEWTPQFSSGSVTRFNYEDWRDRAKSFTGVAAFRPTALTVTGGDEPERIAAKMITATLLPLLGVSLDRGRNFIDAEDRAGGQAVAILSAGFAERRFGGEQAVGQTIQLDGHPFSIVGVLPRRFELFQPADVYLPFWPWAATLPDDRGWHAGIFPIARLKDDISIEQAQLEMNDISRQLESEQPDMNQNVRALVARAQDQMVQNVRPALLMLTWAVVLVLLIACANVANLLLARAVDRQKEMAVRIALGASRFRIARQLIVESVVLSVTGAVAGLLVAAWAVSLLMSTADVPLPRGQNIAIDWPVLLFALVLSLLTGIAFGLAPALQAMHVPIRTALNEDGRGGSGGARHRRIRSVLVVVEVALALVLLVTAGLLLRSFSALTRVAPGFNPDKLLVVNLPLSPQKYHDHAARTALVERLIWRVRAAPGVQAAAITTSLPMAGAGVTIHFNRAAYPPRSPDDYVTAGYRAVSPEYLSTLGVPLRRGRMLTEQDHQGAPRIAVINESMARQYFADRDALGERIQLGTEPDPTVPTMEVVGVVGDMKQGFEAGSKAEIFVPYDQYPDSMMTAMYLNVALVVRTASDPVDAAPSVRAAVRAIDGVQPLVNVRTMDAAIAGTVAQPRLQMMLLVVFAAVALALAAIGVYGVMAYTVSQRTAELGVRMAVGASPRQVVTLVIWEGAQLALRGLALGVIAAVIAAGAMQRLLFEMSGFDPITFAIAPAILQMSALLACYIPARRAARISPFAALGR